MPGAPLSMHHGRIPPAAIGLLAGLMTTAAAVALTATGLLPPWLSTPLVLLAGGLAAGLAAPVRPTTGALLGAAAGVFAAVLLSIALSVLWHPDPDRYYSPFPFALIAVASVMLYVPPNAIAGAVGAAVRPALVARTAAGERARGLTPERRQWLGIAAGALLIIGASWASVLVAPGSLSAVFLVSGLRGRVRRGHPLGRRGAGGGRVGPPLRPSSASGPSRSITWGRPRRRRGTACPRGSGRSPLALMGVVVLPAVALGGALGGSVRKPSAAPRPGAATATVGPTTNCGDPVSRRPVTFAARPPPHIPSPRERPCMDVNRSEESRRPGLAFSLDLIARDTSASSCGSGTGTRSGRGRRRRSGASATSTAARHTESGDFPYPPAENGPDPTAPGRS